MRFLFASLVAMVLVAIAVVADIFRYALMGFSFTVGVAIACVLIAGFTHGVFPMVILQ